MKGGVVVALSARKLRKIRHGLGLSQEKLAVHLGVRRNTVERWERRVHPVPEWAAKLLGPFGKAVR